MGRQEVTRPSVALRLGDCAYNWIPVNPPVLMNVQSTLGTMLAAPGAAASRPGQGINHLANLKMIQLPGSTSDLSNENASRRGPGMGDFIGEWMLSVKVKV